VKANTAASQIIEKKKGEKRRKSEFLSVKKKLVAKYLQSTHWPEPIYSYRMGDQKVLSSDSVNTN